MLGLADRRTKVGIGTHGIHFWSLYSCTMLPPTPPPQKKKKKKKKNDIFLRPLYYPSKLAGGPLWVCCLCRVLATADTQTEIGFRFRV